MTEEGNVGALRTELQDRLIDHQILKEFSTLGIGGIADYFFQANTTQDLLQAARLARSLSLPYRVIGQGSGIVFSDVGFPGLVIRNCSSQILFKPQAGQIIVDSGVLNSSLVNLAAARGVGGVEFLAAIPGTVGGAVLTNATWQGTSISSFVKEVTVFDPLAEGDQVVTLPASKIGFKPFSCALKKGGATSPIVLTVKLQMTQLPAEEVIRRLVRVRHHPKCLQLRLPCLGYYLAQNLQLTAEDQKDLTHLRAPGLRVHPKHPEIIECLSTKVSGLNVRQFINTIRQFIQERTGQLLDERVDYLGYWPDDDQEGA